MTPNLHGGFIAADWRVRHDDRPCTYDGGPKTRGSGRTPVHEGCALTAHPHLTLDLTRIVAYESGRAVHLALTATAGPARRAHHQTRPLTDPQDASAQWSYLDVWLGTIDHVAVADPFLPRPDLYTRTAGLCSYRTEPRYWIPANAAVGSLTLTAENHARTKTLPPVSGIFVRLAGRPGLIRGRLANGPNTSRATVTDPPVHNRALGRYRGH
ncbi:hypothetical protein P3H15_49775 [Rhodococcus sp. T2V]|uniref:hypothetical protein n=1 Tax=Rhodococcus sp. T2V TaxID=3034164 RepID=UPI0023E1A045|nr:hypothetical protein [Rhodococcus sp. T2V]MDF3313016.1 hypothetical protein [Rhodococcus sp. T2V]